MLTLKCKNCGKDRNFSCVQSYKQGLKTDICKSCRPGLTENKNSKIDKLLMNCLNSFYWIGFILADGNFSKTSINIRITNSDKEHVENFKKYIESTVKIGFTKERILKMKEKTYIGKPMCRFTIANKKVTTELRNKFDIHDNKTIYPPNFVNYLDFDKNLLISLFIGLIDGDGSISTTPYEKNYIRIKCHKNWETFYKNLLSKLEIKFKFTTTKEGYFQLMISMQEEIKKLKTFILDHDIHHLKRKWEKINIT